jgi:hypothetical protein
MKKLEGRVALVMGAEDAEALAEPIRGKTAGRQKGDPRGYRQSFPGEGFRGCGGQIMSGGNEYEQP